MEILIPTSPSFNYRRTVLSHGWCELSPCAFDDQSWTLRRVLNVGDKALTVTIDGTEDMLRIQTPRRLGVRAAESVSRDVRHMFRLDDDLNEFYRMMKEDSSFAWVSAAGAGRLLRSPTVYEDLVKTLCTTNCSWALTKIMVTALVTNLGRATNDGQRAFPTPEAMADAPEKFYRDTVRSGYRAPYLKELAGRVASGSLNVEVWLTSNLSTAELKREIKQVKGAGDYAADNLLKLLGRYDGLALDSWVRAKFARTHHRGRVCSDAKIARYYSRFKTWRGLALWCDMTRDWLNDDSALAAESRGFASMT
ncbi:MAG: Fe-S cluster assembly protein HesB [Acidobacteriota bacterium]|nr:Fe-S cluster assembly protein HesB [Acidobacteriota bacterium]